MCKRQLNLTLFSIRSTSLHLLNKFITLLAQCRNSFLQYKKQYNNEIHLLRYYNMRWKIIYNIIRNEIYWARFPKKKYESLISTAYWTICIIPFSFLDFFGRQHQGQIWWYYSISNVRIKIIWTMENNSSFWSRWPFKKLNNEVMYVNETITQ